MQKTYPPTVCSVRSLSCLPDPQDVLKPLDPDVRAALAAQIARDGPCEPLIVWKSRKLVVDGLERLSIYWEMGIKTCPVIYRSFADLDVARRWRIAHNVNRRQLNPWCRAVAAIELVYADWRKRDKGRNGEGEKIDEVVALSHVSKPGRTSIANIASARPAPGQTSD
ncbi:MAG: ParB N-terminal domain-containing protein [Phycisphaeraceae bacterium]|nr:ParB N-terminal domain-containing protein [Phycisphaeraceae bacterium]